MCKSAATEARVHMTSMGQSRGNDLRLAVPKVARTILKPKTGTMKVTKRGRRKGEGESVAICRLRVAVLVIRLHTTETSKRGAMVMIFSGGSQALNICCQ